MSRPLTATSVIAGIISSASAATSVKIGATVAVIAGINTSSSVVTYYCCEFC